MPHRMERAACGRPSQRLPGPSRRPAPRRPWWDRVGLCGRDAAGAHPRHGTRCADGRRSVTRRSLLAGFDCRNGPRRPRDRLPLRARRRRVELVLQSPAAQPIRQSLRSIDHRPSGQGRDRRLSVLAPRDADSAPAAEARFERVRVSGRDGMGNFPAPAAHHRGPHRVRRASSRPLQAELVRRVRIDAAPVAAAGSATWGRP